MLKVTEMALGSIKSGSVAFIFHHNCLSKLLREITKMMIFKHKTALAYGKAHQILTETMSGNNHHSYSNTMDAREAFPFVANVS